MAVFLKLGDIKGTTTQASHRDWIEVQSFQFGVGRGISSSGPRREATPPSVSEVTLTKTLDLTSPALLRAALGGKPVEARIELTRADDTGRQVAYQTYLLGETLVSGYSVASQGERPIETFSLNFSRIESEYIALDDRMEQVGREHVAYDIARATLA